MSQPLPDPTAAALFAGHGRPLLRLDRATGRVHAGNRAAGRLCRREPGELVGRPVAELLRPVTARAAALLRPDMAARGPVRYAPAGRPVRLRPYWLPDPDPAAALLLLVPSRRSARRRADLFRTLFDRLPVLLCLYEAGGRIRHVNRELENCFGWSAT